MDARVKPGHDEGMKSIEVLERRAQLGKHRRQHCAVA